MYPALPLSRQTNTRDLGGIPIPGGETRQGQFLRSGRLWGLTQADCALLYDYGVRCVVDLRSPFETSGNPSALEGFPGVNYYNIPLNDQVHGAEGHFPSSLESLYRTLLGEQESMARIFQAFLEFPEDCVLFNCTAGKDRTGLTAMLLLKLAGVSDEDVILDYAATEQWSIPWEKAQRELTALLGASPPEYIFRAKPDTMKATLSLLETEYGGAASYLSSAGLSPAALSALRRKLGAAG